MNLSKTAKILLFAAAFMPGIAAAQTVTVTQDMDFGQVSLMDNNSAHQIAFQTNGSYLADSEYYFLDTPTIAHVVVDGYPPNTDLDISFSPNPGSLTPVGGTGTFTVDNFFTIPSTVTTNGVGHVTFDVGARLRNDGSAASYGDTRFSIPITITVTQICGRICVNPG